MASLLKSSRLIFKLSQKHGPFALQKYKSLCPLSSFISTQHRFFSNGGDIVDPEDTTPPIPTYAERTGESIQLKRARLVYQSRKRGMLENGLLLSTFASKYLDSFTEDQLSIYDRLINQPTNDWEIYYWATGVKDTPEEYNSDVMELLKAHTKNDERDSRIRQPDLY